MKKANTFEQLPLDVNVTNFDGCLEETMFEDEHNLNIYLHIKAKMKIQRPILNGDFVSIQFDENSYAQ